MRKYERYALAVFMSSALLFSACSKETGTDVNQTTSTNSSNSVTESEGASQTDKLTSEVQTTDKHVSEGQTTDKPISDETTKDNTSGEQDKGGQEETTENVTDKPVESKVLEGFYNCTQKENHFVRVDFEIKQTPENCMALFYSQYTEVDTYDRSMIYYGDKTGTNTYEFTDGDEKYTVSWDGSDKLTVKGGEFSGIYERGVRDGYGEGDYMESDILCYEADVNVANGIELDSTLGKAIRAELGYDDSHVLTLEDLESVTYLATWDYEIASVKGIAYLKNLEEIHIGENYISDISEMAQLTNIKAIDVSNGYVKEIPDFSNCKNLHTLYLGGNMIEDVSPVAKIPNIKYVDLNTNFIKSIEPLKGAKTLEMLCIYNNCILDYGSIKDCDYLIAAYDECRQCTYESALKLENRVKEIVASFPSQLSELELEKLIYKYIKDNMYYDESLRPTSAFGYSGIMNGWGVCGDYAQAFALIANHAGLEAYECGSDTHAWNIVKIDGVYYHCDALWDENVDEWIHFNKSTGYIYNLPDHMHDLRRYPICDVSMSVLEYCDCFGVQ